MASALYTDIKKWKDGKPGSIFCRPREGLFGMRDWADDPELAHLVAPSNGPDGEEKFLVMSSENAKRGHMKRGGEPGVVSTAGPRGGVGSPADRARARRGVERRARRGRGDVPASVRALRRRARPRRRG
jgi:hypothetical protein